MCGIAGIVAYHSSALPIDAPELLRMRDHMAARGPDGKGEWISSDRRVGFGHRRLSIIDLSEGGAQPMLSADGRLVITFNGEIYNYRELRRGLESRGCVFRTSSDTEVLLHLYAEKGEAMLGDLRGMFAFAIWDADRQATLLARDPYGIKPLYYADDGWTLRFASQVKALLAGGKVSRTQEPAGVVGFYLFGSVPEPYTLYQEIRSVPAGSAIWVDAVGPTEPQSYFSAATIWAAAENHGPIDVDEAATAVGEALRDSVRHHMVADVPIAAFLSAGIDSGALVGLMCEVGEAAALSTLTLSFEEYRGSQDDEALLAADVAQHYGAQHSICRTSEQEFRAELPAILQAMDQPSIDGINTWFISKAASQAGLKVAISGLGGDELFGGYPSFRDIPRWLRALWLPAHIPGLGAVAEQAHDLFAPLFLGLNPKAGGMVRYGGSYAGAFLLRRGLFLPHELPKLMDPDLAREGLRRLSPLNIIRDSLQEEDTAGHKIGPQRAYGKIALMEAGIYMRNQLLRDTDWASMAHSLEVRVPLVDGKLLSAVAGKLSAVSTENRKVLLSRAPEKPLPMAVQNRPKSGFTTPIAQWQKNLGDLSWSGQTASKTANWPWARHWSMNVTGQKAE
jgi:asparagine synthase (glutamine-hydrolysing)